MDQENILRPYGVQEDGFRIMVQQAEEPLVRFDCENGTLTLRDDVREALKAIVRDMVREEMQAAQAGE